MVPPDQTPTGPTRRVLLDAATAELDAFDRVGRKDLALDAWHAAREAADTARRECWTALRAEYGARNPHWGWASFTLFVAAISAGVAGVLASGLRFDPANTAIIAAVLAAIAALGALTVILSSRFRPMSDSASRPLLVVTIGLVAAAAFQLSHALTTAPVVGAAAVIGIGAFLTYFVVRARDPEGTAEIDTAINVAFARMRPEVAAIGERMQADLTARLTVSEQEGIVGMRGAIPEGAPVDDRAPAGGVIIAVLLGTWVPDALRESGV